MLAFEARQLNSQRKLIEMLRDDGREREEGTASRLVYSWRRKKRKK